MKNLLVCKEITIGRKVSDQSKLRVVTLDGDTIETTGVFTGGGGYKKSGKIGQNPMNNINIEEQLQVLKAEIGNLNAEKHGIDEELEALTEDNDRIMYEKQKIAGEITI